MPSLRIAASVMMEEGDCRGEVVVVFDEVGQVGVCFATFVEAGVKRGGGIVYGVDCSLPAIRGN